MPANCLLSQIWSNPDTPWMTMPFPQIPKRFSFSCATKGQESQKKRPSQFASPGEDSLGPGMLSSACLTCGPLWLIWWERGGRLRPTTHDSVSVLQRHWAVSVGGAEAHWAHCSCRCVLSRPTFHLQAAVCFLLLPAQVECVQCPWVFAATPSKE